MITKDNSIDNSQNVLSPISIIVATSSIVALWFAVNHKPVSLELLILWPMVIVSIFMIRWLSRASSALASKLFIVIMYLGLFVACLTLETQWLPFFAILLTFVSILIHARLGTTLSIMVFAAMWVMSYSGFRDYPIEFYFAMILAIVVAQVIVDRLYTALHWYSSMNERMEQLLRETQQNRAELRKTLQSLRNAHNLQQRIQQELIEARQQAVEARQLKERFAANISHELRTPLNIIMGFSEVIHLTPEVYTETALPVTLRRDISQIYQNSRYLLELVDDILDLSHIEQTEFTLQLEQTDLFLFLEDFRRSSIDLLNSHPAAFDMDYPAELPYILIEQVRIRQVLLNLEMPQYADRGVAAPIDMLVEEVGVDMSGFSDVIVDMSMRDGNLSGFPIDIHPIGMYYNVDAVEAAGLDPDSPPTNAEELLSWAEALTIDSDGDGTIDQYGVSAPATNVMTFRLWWGLIFQNGGSFISDDLSTITIANDEAAEALEFLRDLVAVHGVAPEGQSDPDTDFLTGSVAITFQGPWWITGFVDAGLNFRTAPVPTPFIEPGVWASSHYFGVSVQDDHDSQVSAMKFAKWMSDNGALWGLSGQVPASAAARADETFTGSDIYQYQEAFVNSLDDIHYTPPITVSTEIFAENVQTPLVIGWQSVMLGTVSAADALSEMQAGIQAVLDR